ncbi:MAG: PHP domain-containing protein [Chloroflexi bacterium]|mgnify:CR=1 FL=1|nr:PHP domain-containing protein [Chloroflexota bacterium]
MPIDLHAHTYYSDGRFAPAQVIETAAQRGIRVLAITDHDNTNGAREALPLAKAAGIELIPAIEITTRWDGVDLPPQDANVDLLGYFIDWDQPDFRAFETAALADIHARIDWCCRELTRRGTPLSMEEVMAQNPRYGGAVAAINAILNKGLAPDFRAAARRFDSVWFEVRKSEFSIFEAIELIHRAGGAAVLAHPSIVRPGGERLTRAHLAKLVDAGLDGIEVYHRRLDLAAREYFLDLAESLGLLVTGGSDLHGWLNGFDGFGAQPVTAQMLLSLRSAARGNHHGRNI